MISVVLLICLIFPLSIIYNIKYIGTNKSENNTDVLSLGNSMILRGIAAFFVLFTHYLNNIQIMGVNIGKMSIFMNLGGIGVLIFFFLSGYGVYVTGIKKELHLDYIINKIKKIYIPVVLIRALMLAAFELNNVIRNTKITDKLLYILNLKDSLWFVNLILLIYLIFFVSVKISKKKSILIVTLLIFAISAVFVIMSFPDRWYNGSLLFVEGMLFAKYKDIIYDYAKKHYLVIMILALGVFGGCGFTFSIFKGNVLVSFFKTLSGMALCMVIYLLVMKFKLNSLPMKYFGRMSLYLWITHTYVWALVNSLYKIKPVYGFWICMIISMAATCVIDKIQQMCKCSKK